MDAIERRRNRRDYSTEQLAEEMTHLTTEGGLIWRNDKIIMLPEADWVAQRHGYGCAERMVEAMEKQKEVLNESRKSD